MAAPILFVGIQLLVGSAWSSPYSWAHNNISDLGNVTCGAFGDPLRHVCSPQHSWMNWAFLLTALLLAFGVGATWSRWGRGGAATTVRILVLLCAAGYALAGAYPADVAENLHVLGAILIMGPGNLALATAVAVPRTSPLSAVRLPTLALAIIGIAGTTLHLSRNYAGLGVGGTERLAAFALLLWVGLIGALFLARRETFVSPPALLRRE